VLFAITLQVFLHVLVDGEQEAEDERLNLSSEGAEG
jgi:hypothetical protein